MNRVIYKYPIAPDASIPMPQGARILSVAVQRNQPCIWALVDPQAPTEMRRFRTVATGMQFCPDELTFIGTFHGVEGWMVFHLFEVKEQA